MAKATANCTNSALTNSSTSSPNHEADDHDSRVSTQQPFRFMDLPPELRGIIYTFALDPKTRKNHEDGPQLTAGLSGSKTALALSQVCRVVRRESMKTFYSNTTFVVRDLPDHWKGFLSRLHIQSANARPAPPAPEPLDVWARTWGVHGAQHIRSLYLVPLEGTARISLVDDVKRVCFDEAVCAKLSAAALESARSKAFGRSGRRAVTARDIETLLREVGNAWSSAWRRKILAKSIPRHRREVCEGKMQRLEEALTDLCTSAFALDSVFLELLHLNKRVPGDSEE